MEANSLFSSRTKGPSAAETLEGDDEATEEAAYRRAFGEHGKMFSDLQESPDEVLMLGDDEGEEGKPKVDPAGAAVDDAEEDSASESEDEGYDGDDQEASINKKKRRNAEEKAQVAAAKIAGLLEVESGRYCSSFHQTYFERSFPELHSIL
jgi:hypothetical protein